MKKTVLLYTLLPLAASLASCDDFLDTMPDNRAEVNSQSTVSSILVSAYSDAAPLMMMEFSTDNVTDNGALYSSIYKEIDEMYAWKDVTMIDAQDDPMGVWEAEYKAIASANMALEYIEEQGDSSVLAPYKAEALLCRAYAHFCLANAFCLTYNPETAGKDMGIPYVMEPEKQLFVKRERGTMAELYSKIDADIEAALPYVNDEIYKVPKYHFNRKAAYAFAARFNLLYLKPDKSNYKKVIEYADKVLGSNPAAVVRNMANYTSYGAEDFSNMYVRDNEPANLLIQPVYSILGRVLTGSSSRRYSHNVEIVSYETILASGPWSLSGDYDFFIAKVYGSNQVAYFPKLLEFFEMTDKANQTGHAHIAYIPFTGDETLLCRAEAYALSGEYDKAAADLNIWQDARCKSSVTIDGKTMKLLPLTPDQVDLFYKKLPYSPVPLDPLLAGTDRSIRKTLHPQGFTVEPGRQENLIQCVLHFRRLEGLHDGLRWIDVKRYGIEVVHMRDGESPDVLKVNDLRRALQLPSDAINAGVTANPR